MNSDRAHGASRFEARVRAAILANSAVLGWGWIDHAHDVASERIDTCFLVFFLVLFVARLRRAGWRWLTRPWNLLDATIILVALLPVLGDGITVLRLARAARIVHLGRHSSHLRRAPFGPPTLLKGLVVSRLLAHRGAHQFPSHMSAKPDPTRCCGSVRVRPVLRGCASPLW